MTRLKPGTSSPPEAFRRHNRTALPTLPIRSKHPNDAPKGQGESNRSLNQDPGTCKSICAVEIESLANAFEFAESAKNTEENYHHEPHEPHEPEVIHDEDGTGSGPRWHHSYIDITANSNARQINGDILSESTVLVPAKNFYEGIVATEDSQQINGNVSDGETLKAFFS